MRKRTPKGEGKDMVIYASVNHLSVPEAVRHFNVPRSTIYKAASAMGIILKAAKQRPVRRVVDTP